ncbi:hypothetical protein [Clostridium scatologenes]|uniref:Uncharacterized protein n=1 Tax=Clostridium scatologenes TaxID=1548 RepID=A0A0E3JZQ2_CLOSL|nr:hypothetical protein [Clostridium scatologenes]AKA68533.1 hypothetical protein CSCA_1408 [Clostridium scatologenes]
MKVEKAIKPQQPDIHKKSNQQNNGKKHRREQQEHLSFSDVMELMKHSSYKRHKGAIKQIK